MTWIDVLGMRFLLQDGEDALYIRSSDELGSFDVGDRVVVRGQTAPGLIAPIVVRARLRRIARDSWPPAPEVTLAYSDIVDLDCRLVSARGTVRAARARSWPFNGPDHWRPLLRLAGAQPVDVWLPPGMLVRARELVDSEVRVRATVH